MVFAAPLAFTITYGNSSCFCFSPVSPLLQACFSVVATALQQSNCLLFHHLQQYLPHLFHFFRKKPLFCVRLWPIGTHLWPKHVTIVLHFIHNRRCINLQPDMRNLSQTPTKFSKTSWTHPGQRRDRVPAMQHCIIYGRRLSRQKISVLDQLER